MNNSSLTWRDGWIPEALRQPPPTEHYTTSALASSTVELDATTSHADQNADRVVRRVPLQHLDHIDLTLTPPSNTDGPQDDPNTHNEDDNDDDDEEASGNRRRRARTPPRAVQDDDDDLPALLDLTDSSDSDLDSESDSDSNARNDTGAGGPLHESDDADFPELLDVSDSDSEWEEDSDDADDHHHEDAFASGWEQPTSYDMLQEIHRVLQQSNPSNTPPLGRRPAQLVAVFQGLTGSLADDGLFDAKRAEELMRGLEPVGPDLLKRYLRAAGTDAEVMCAVCREDLVVEDDREPLTSIPDLSSPLDMRDRVETPLPTPPTLFETGPPPPFMQPQPPATSADVLALPCRHAFHAACLHPWLARRTTCPTCRMDLDPESLTLSIPPPAVAVQDGLFHIQGAGEREPLLPGPGTTVDARDLGLVGSPDLPERPLAPSVERELSVPPDLRARAATPPLQDPPALQNLSDDDSSEAEDATFMEMIYGPPLRVAVAPSATSPSAGTTRPLARSSTPAGDAIADFIDRMNNNRPFNPDAIRDFAAMIDDHTFATVHEPSAADIRGTLLDNPYTAPRLGLPSTELNDVHHPPPNLLSRPPGPPPQEMMSPGQTLFSAMLRQRIDSSDVQTHLVPEQPRPRRTWTRPAGKTLLEWVEERENELGYSIHEVTLNVPAPPHPVHDPRT